MKLPMTNDEFRGAQNRSAASWTAAGSAAPRRFRAPKTSASPGAVSSVRKRCRRCALPPQSKTRQSILCGLTLNLILWIALISLGGNVFAQTNKNVPGPSDYARFSGFVTERNIYDPNRQPHYSSGGRPRTTTRPRTRSSAAAPTIALVGTMAYEKGSFAFFSSNDSEQKKVLPVAGKIAGYKIVEILPAGVRLEAADKKQFAMRVGEVFRQENGGWQLAGQGDVPATAATAGGAASEKSGDSGESKPSAAIESNDVLKRLMEKREKENK